MNGSLREDPRSSRLPRESYDVDRHSVLIDSESMNVMNSVGSSVHDTSSYSSTWLSASRAPPFYPSSINVLPHSGTVPHAHQSSTHDFAEMSTNAHLILHANANAYEENPRRYAVEQERPYFPDQAYGMSAMPLPQSSLSELSYRNSESRSPYFTHGHVQYPMAFDQSSGHHFASSDRLTTRAGMPIPGRLHEPPLQFGDSDIGSPLNLFGPDSLFGGDSIFSTAVEPVSFGVQAPAVVCVRLFFAHAYIHRYIDT